MSALSPALRKSSRAKSGYHGVIYDGRPSARQKPWSVSVKGFRSKGYDTARAAAAAYAEFARASSRDAPAPPGNERAISKRRRAAGSSRRQPKKAHGLAHTLQDKTSAGCIDRRAADAPTPAPVAWAWWEKSTVSAVSRPEIERMQLFGVRVEFTFNSAFASTPIYPRQKASELSRLSGKTVDASCPARQVHRMLRDELVALLRGRAAHVPALQKKRAAPGAAPVDEAALLASLSLSELYSALRTLHPDSTRTGTVVGYLPAIPTHVVDQ